MGEKTTSKTEEQIDGLPFLPGSPYKTTISDDDKRAEGYGNTSEESQKDASEKWESGETESKSGCYLTTACVRAMQHPDNCLELEILRYFRDKILMPEPSGRRAVREYYRLAPEIVSAIEAQANAQCIWQSVYRDIRHTVSLVLSDDFESAFKHYQQMTMRFKGKYLD